MFGSGVDFLPGPKSKDNYVWFARHLLFVQLNVRAKNNMRGTNVCMKQKLIFINVS